MVEAVHTSVSAAGTWAIVIVAVTLLAFWLIAITLADRSQVRASGRAPLAGGIGPGAALAGGNAGGERTPEIPGEAVHEPIAQQDRRAWDEPAGERVPQGEVPTRDDLPAQQAATGPHPMPRQRTGDADRAARSQAVPGTRDDAAGR